MMIKGVGYDLSLKVLYNCDYTLKSFEVINREKWILINFFLLKYIEVFEN